MRLFGRSRESDEATDQALERTRRGFLGRLGELLLPGDVTEEFWESLEETLIGADAGVETTFEVLEHLRAEGPDRTDQVREMLRRELIAIIARPLERPRGRLWGVDDADLPTEPHVVLVTGVNGSGKTTLVARLAHAYQREGQSVICAAGDTFRAAAIEQLQEWGRRLDFDVIASSAGGDPAAVAFDTIAAARARERDVVLIDTAGRLQNKQNLMDELSKVRRVVERQSERGPDEVLLVLDATTGQNGMSQAAAFLEAVDVTSVALTKLDGTAKGGIVFAIAREFDLPVRFVGTGGGPEDLAPFDPEAFVDALLGSPLADEAAAS